MTMGSALIVILVGLLIAIFVHSGIGMIVSVIGLVGLLVAAFNDGKRL